MGIDMNLVCSDEAIIPAPPDVVYEALVDLTDYEQWNTAVDVEPLGPTRLAPGVRYQYSGKRPDGKPAMSWVIEVIDLVPGRRIDLEYVEGDLLGPTGWELEPAGSGTRTAFVYRGVRPTNAKTAATFEHFGLAVHNLAMAATLDGLTRYVTGQPLGDAWEAEVAARLSAGVAELMKSSS